MSLPQYETRCTGCDEKWGVTRRSWFLGFLYDAPGNTTRSISYEVCWCFDCNSLAHAEDFEQHIKKKDWYKRHVRRLTRVRYGMSSEILIPARLRARRNREDKRNSPEMERLRARAFLPPQRHTLDQAIKEVNSRLSTSTFWLEFLGLRQSPPKCLSCAGHDFQYINSAHEKKNISEDSSVHPGCGGKLYEQESGWRFSLGVFTILYDMEGNRIDSDSAPWRGKSKFQD
mgnify:CR=1 FL=1